MKIAITGANGYIGRCLMPRLLEKGHSICALSRRSFDPIFADKAFKPIYGDIRSMESLQSLVQDSDSVIHLAAYVHKNPGSDHEKRSCFEVNVDGTRNLLEQIEKSGRKQGLVYISSIAVYGSRFSLIQEESICNPTTVYARSKFEAEKLVLDAIRKGIITGCILRPAMVCGVNAPGNLQSMIGLMRMGVFPLIERGQNLKSLIYVEDLVELIVTLVDRSMDPRIYNIAADPPLSIRQIAEALTRGLGRSMIYIPVNAKIAEMMSRINYSRFQHLAQKMEAFSATTTVDTSAIRNQLHFQFRPTEEILTQIAASSLRVA